MNHNDFGYWLTGFVDGEGCFHARSYIRKKDGAHVLATYFSIKLRFDDLPILQKIQKIWGVGRIYDYPEKLSRHKQVDYRVNHRYDLRDVVIPFFDKYPLQSKKGSDYEIWRHIVLNYKITAYRHNKLGTRTLADERWEEVCKLVDRLRNGRKPDPLTADLAERDPKMAAQAKKRLSAIQTIIEIEASQKSMFEE